MLGDVSTNSLLDVLRGYRAGDHSQPWMLATVVTKYRSSYRKPGAMMLVDPLGRSIGLISGGCLEANIRLQARQVQVAGSPRCVVYDSMDEDNIAAELGLGCNGRVQVLVQELTASHQRVLVALLEALESGKSYWLAQCFQSTNPEDLKALVLLDEQGKGVLTSEGAPPVPALSLEECGNHQLISDGERDWSVNRQRAPVDFWVFGGGVDARPMVQLARQLGWKVTLVDHRVTHAREADFPEATAIVRSTPEQLTQPISADAAVLMSHNLSMDARWLAALASLPLSYVGVLGPGERKRQVLEEAGLPLDSEFASRLHGPMGFDIGGDLPESIALSVLAQCHQVVFKGAGLGEG